MPDDLLGRARELVGVTGRSERVPFAPAVLAAGTGWEPALVLSALAFADSAAIASITLVTPQIRASVGTGSLGSFVAFGPVLFVAGALVSLRLLPRRIAVARGAAALAAVASIALALSTSSVAVLACALLASAASGATAVVVAPMLADAYRPEVRVRALAAYAGAVVAGLGAADLTIAVGGRAGLTWRGALVVVALFSALALLAASRLANPPVGVHDRDRVQRAVEAHAGGRGPVDPEIDAADTELGLAEHFRRVLAPPAASGIVGLAAAFGLFARALPSFTAELLRQRWALTASSRTLVEGLLFVSGLAGAVWIGRHGEVALRRSPSALLRRGVTASLVSAVGLAVAAACPWFGLAVVALAVASAGFVAMLVVAYAGLFMLSEPRRRSDAAALLAGAIVLAGPIGTVVLATIGDRFGIGWAMLTAAAVALAAGGSLVRSVASADADLDAALGRMIEVDELATFVSQGRHLPLLSCRHVDFSYGQVQVLFDVSFSVDDGEMVALLGTNGAGKSTLLRVISGLCIPNAGSVQYRGADVTFLDTDRRVQLGISQVPGGRAVFGAMSVVDNLRAFGHTCGRERRRLERGIEETFDAFPQLGERRDQLASTLSGGEQQMLALGKAFILEPRLVLIDELSLGLAPIVVGALLDMVRRINERGTAVVLVEQSVNIALSVVNHAYFMEKGEMRFDGPAGDLLERPDLLRSVFLRGAAAGMGFGGSPS